MAHKLKFQALTDYLSERNEKYITLTFNQIEKILGFDLESSYRTYRQNWANNIHERPYRACVSAGYKFGYVDMKSETVELVKDDCSIDLSNERQIKRQNPSKHKTNGIIITDDMLERVRSTVKYDIAMLYSDTVKGSDYFTGCMPGGKYSSVANWKASVGDMMATSLQTLLDAEIFN